MCVLTLHLLTLHKLYTIEKYCNTYIFLITACKCWSPYLCSTNELMKTSINSKKEFKKMRFGFSVPHSGFSVPAFPVQGFSTTRKKVITHLNKRESVERKRGSEWSRRTMSFWLETVGNRNLSAVRTSLTSKGDWKCAHLPEYYPDSTASPALCEPPEPKSHMLNRGSKSDLQC